MSHTPKPSKELQNSRWLMLTAIVLYPIWSLLYHWLFPGVYDPLVQRLLVSAGIAVLLLASFLPALARRIRWLMGGAYFLLGSHFLSLVGMNAFSPAYMVGAFITFIAIAVAIGDRLTLILFSGFLVLSTLGMAIAFQTPDAAFFWFGLLTIQLVAFISLNWRLGLQEHLLRSEASLRQMQQSLMEAQHLAHIGSWSWDPQSDGMLWSEELYRILGLVPGSVVNRARFLATVHPADRPLVENVLSAHPLAPFSLDYRILLPDDTERHIHGRADVLLDERGHPVRMLGMAQDITDRVKADRYKDEFLSVISHELRTPLNFIMGFASLIQDGVDGSLNPTQFEHLGKILEGAERMLALVDNLLDMGRMQAGKFHLAPSGIDYPALIEEVCASLQPVAAQKQLHIEAHTEAPMVVTVDGQRIAQVLTNLITNAIKFSPPQGQILVSTEWLKESLVTRVSDHGPGIARTDVPKLFTRFTQLDMSPTRQASGVGLGLSICKAIIEAHGGQIGVESVVGKGATFWFSLPHD